MSFTIDLNDIEMYGSGLVRPEGVMATPDGTVWCAHGGGHCTRIDPDGTEEHIGDLGGQPNGICIDRYGNLKGPSLPCFQVPHPGMPLIHQM